MATILYVDDEPAIGPILEDTLGRMGHTTLGAHTVPEALQLLARGGVELVVSAYRMPGLSALELLELMRREGHAIPLVVLTPCDPGDHALSAIQAGAADCVAKPIRAEQLRHAVGKALAHAQLQRENDALRREVTSMRCERRIVGESAAMRRLLQTIATAAPTQASVLLQGEPGTGKALLARALHDQSDRRDRPFVTVDCAALPEAVVESTLFGTERGFAGAPRREEGALERAHGGTLLLAEVAALRPEIQGKLLRALQAHALERVGGTTPVPADVRVVATTSRDLEGEIAAGRFRRDLHLKLGVIPLRLPPLRERLDDVPQLALHFATQAGRASAKEIASIAPEALALLARHEWPGNVRELRQAVERALVVAQGPVLEPAHFEQERLAAPRSWANARITGPRPIAAIAANGARPEGARPDAVTVPDGAVVLTTLDLDDAEEKLIARALEVTGGNRTRAAGLLGLSVRTLRNKLNAPNRQRTAAAT